MIFAELGLWKDEETRIHECITSALSTLITSGIVQTSDDEDTISGKLFRFLLRSKKQCKLNQFNIVRQLAVYEKPEDAKPNGFPDFGFLWTDSDCDQQEYHVECKRVNPRSPKSSWDFCSQYVCNGIQRYSNEVYGKGSCNGVMIGYIQLGDLEILLGLVNETAKRQRINSLILDGSWKHGSWTKLSHQLPILQNFILTHYWADFRKSTPKMN